MKPGELAFKRFSQWLKLKTLLHLIQANPAADELWSIVEFSEKTLLSPQPKCDPDSIPHRKSAFRQNLSAWPSVR